MPALPDMQNLSGAVTDGIESHGRLWLVLRTYGPGGGAGGRGGRGGGGLGLGLGGWANLTAECRMANSGNRRQDGAFLQGVTDTTAQTGGAHRDA
jgi:hypothetical protein